MCGSTPGANASRLLSVLVAHAGANRIFGTKCLLQHLTHQSADARCVAALVQRPAARSSKRPRLHHQPNACNRKPFPAVPPPSVVSAVLPCGSWVDLQDQQPSKLVEVTSTVVQHPGKDARGRRACQRAAVQHSMTPDTCQALLDQHVRKAELDKAVHSLDSMSPAMVMAMNRGDQPGW